MVKGKVDDEEYKEPFSKGILARSLTTADMGSKKAYEAATEIESRLIKNNVKVISIADLSKFVADYLREEDPEIAKKYTKWRTLRKTNGPLIILIGGASGVGTSSMAFELANKLGLKNLISTDMIREVMRKIVSKDLSPVLHKSSFDAHKAIRIPNITLNPVVEGFRSQVEVVSVGVEAIIERSIKEGISTIIEGVHIVPGFINNELIEKYNIVVFTLTIKDEEIHKSRFYSRCRQPWVKRSLQSYLDNFSSIRETQDFIVNQAKLSNSYIIDNVDVTTTIDKMMDDIIDKYGGIK